MNILKVHGEIIDSGGDDRIADAICLLSDPSAERADRMWRKPHREEIDKIIRLINSWGLDHRTMNWSGGDNNWWRVST